MRTVTGVEPMSVLSSPKRQHMGSDAQGSQLGASAVLHTGDLARWVSSLAVAGAEAALVLPGASSCGSEQNSILVNTVSPNLVLGSKVYGIQLHSYRFCSQTPFKLHSRHRL